MREITGNQRSGETSTRNSILISFVIFFIALLLRLWSIYEISLSNPFYEFIIIDAKSYDDWGQKIASGDVWGKEVFYQDPLYPYFLGLVYFIFGHKVLPVLIIQSIMGALSTLLVFLIARKTRNLTTGLIAALLWAFYAPMVFYENLIMKEGLAGFLILLTLYILVMAGETGKRRYWIWGGVVLALSALTRGNMLVLIPFIVFWIFFKHRDKCIESTILFFLGLTFILAPVAARNASIGGEFVLTTAQAGQNFYWGNNPSSNGTLLTAPGFLRSRPPFEQRDFDREAIRLTGRKMSPNEISRFWFSKGFEFIVNNPLQFGLLQFHKLRLLLNDEEISDNYQYYFYKKFSPLLKYSPIGFGLVATLGLMGMLICRKKRGGTIPLYLFFFSYSASVILFMVTSRYRLPIAPVLTIFAASAIVWFWERYKEKDFAGLGGGTLLLVLIAMFCFSEIPWLSKHNRIDVLSKEGDWLRSQGTYEEAISVYEESIRLSPKNLDGHFGLGSIYFEKKEFGQAAKSYQRAFEIEPRSAVITSKLGISYIYSGQIDRGIPALYRSIRLEPNQSKTYLELSKALDSKGRHKEAEKYRLEYRRHIGKESDLY